MSNTQHGTRMISRPTKSQYHPFYDGYISMVESVPDIIEFMADQPDKLRQFVLEHFGKNPDHAYAEGKWTVKQLIGHCIDAERIMAYRALCIARGEQQALPGFDENTYVENANFKNRELGDLLEEFELLRKSNLAMISQFDSIVFQNVGNANGSPTSVGAIVYILAGHLQHHIKVLKERYL